MDMGILLHVDTQHMGYRKEPSDKANTIKARSNKKPYTI